VNIVVTGRDASESLIEISDTVTEMVKIKHPYDQGVMSRRGIDY
jgi:cob(I)alamin adenosyltransferase